MIADLGRAGKPLVAIFGSGRCVADMTLSRLGSPGGVRGHIFISWLHLFKKHNLAAVGNKAMVLFIDTGWYKFMLFRYHIDWMEGARIPFEAEGEPVSIVDTEPLRAECARFLECLETRSGTSVT